MRVYQTDRNGYYVGAVEADPDPMNEGEFLIPGGCVLQKPPEVSPGQRARWLRERWILEYIHSSK